jgi:hypothetical protein
VRLAKCRSITVEQIAKAMLATSLIGVLSASRRIFTICFR